jgi:spore coat polysaccharide biosynthesis predicted glycosyltransferase SpsG/CMP-N-acetylneuraminic acid synthetase
MITDVVVTTDSPDVRIIASQMGAGVHECPKELYGEDVTLDPVVFDAIPKDKDWDYIVTMEPKSPALSPETLDLAIRRAIDNGLDSLVSVVNLPSLSWMEQGGRRVPDYEERLNRRDLPPHYVETGAFLISKGSIVTAKTRIGENVDVFEVPENEALEIRGFNDLRTAGGLLQHEKVGIYVNGNNKRGIGHIYRALEIADEFYSMPDIYYDVNQTDPKVFGDTDHKLIGVDGIADLFERCKKKDYTYFINDILTTSIDYMIGLRSVVPHAKVINFEDDGEGILKADLVFNALYKDDDLPQVKAGSKYYLSAKTFLFYEPVKVKPEVEHVFASFGGADPQNYSDRVLKMIASNHKYDGYRFTFVLGRAKLHVKKLLEYNKYDNIEVLYDVANMPEIMSSCDMAITSRGRTGYELAILGIPSIAMAQNQREEKHGFVCNENGFTYLGLNPPDEIIESNLDMYLHLSAANRQRFQDMLLSHDLRNGRKRIMGLIRSL